ncbi:glycosyltransferase family 4 protein [Streptomyces thermolilacinus]|uniref:glycosyltransferase family 4 protein n=1 Tax=Streptomyces thermolilacinus TaxID=285540 RepID=UPI0003C74FC6|nr:glycosyltransferase family 4 protein [Streptomyces thermolilacinus]
MKISFLIHTVYGIGGTIRTTLNLAEALAERHEVEIVSVFRHRDIPLFTIDPRITVVPLVDTRPKSPTCEKDHPDQLTPAEFFPRAEARYKEYSRLTDERVRAHYARSDADVVIGTRPGLVAYVARFAPEEAVLIGQEHMTHNHHKPALREELRPHLEALDAFVTVSEGDAAVWRERMDLPVTRVLCIPNSVPEPMVAPSDQSGTTVVAAGRLSPEKRYDVLIRAFAKVVAVRPEWTLRICGWGTERDKLRRHIETLGLHNHVFLMGPRSPIEPEWVKGAIAASTSRHESFGMTLVESMRCGVPMVSTDCDYGPREIIKDGEDGLLVPVGDVDAVAAALLRLIEDEGLRRRMGEAALRNARRFDPSVVAERYDALFTELGAGTRRRGAAAGAGTGAAPGAGPAPGADAVVDAGAAAGAPAEAEGRVGAGAGIRGRGAASLSGAPTGGGAHSAVPDVQEESPREHPADDGHEDDAGFAPVADCVAEADGSLTVTLLAPPAAAAHHDAPCLVAVLQGPQPVERTYAFRPDGTLTIPAGDDLAEGNWECHVEHAATGARAPLTARAVDQRGSLRPADRMGPGDGVRHLVPYRRPPRHLLELRSWVRAVHAEAGDIGLTDDHATLTGRLLGPVTDRADRPELVMRRYDSHEEAAVPGTWLPGDRFRIALPWGELAGRRRREQDTWALWLRYAPDRPPVKVARLLDDVVAKADVFAYRPVRRHKRRPLLLARRLVRKVRRQPQLMVELTLRHDGHNALYVRVTDA